MLNCRACLWRCIDALDTPVAVSRSLRLRHNVTSAFAQGQRRTIRTDADTDVPVPRKYAARPRSEVDKLARSPSEPWKKSTQAAGLRTKVEKGLKRQPRNITARGQSRGFANRSEDKRPKRLEYDKRIGGYKKVEESKAEEPSKDDVAITDRRLGRRDPNMSSIDWNRRRKELQYLSDPLELANFVKKELMKDKATEMLQLVQMASHSMQVIVSWNHLIDYHLAKQKVSQALKIYNEMKKRAQFPDSYTYTILLRGLAINAHDSGALAKALSVYHSMSAPNSRVEPSIMHTNAMLKVCSRAMDMDALWGVAAKIPETGPASANAITYVTILNTIRQSLLIDPPLGETEEQVAARKERGISEGRRVWQDVIAKWRNADLVIGEELVCAMGRLLLVGARPRDWDDVLSLVEQTMDIPRLVPRLGTPARSEAGYPHLRAPNVPESYRLADDHLNPQKDVAVRGDEFLALSPKSFGRVVSNPLAYATPSNNTLSMIQEACQKIVANKASRQYWDMLTDPTTYSIIPDTNNLNFRLRLLRQNRSSEEAVTLLKNSFILRGITPRPGTFRIAMSTCVRDKNNHNSLRHGGEILRIMQEILDDADSKTVSMYADLAISFPLGKGADLVDALTLLRPMYHNIRIQLGVSTARGVGRRHNVILQGDERKDAIVALRKVHAIFDKLLFSNLIEERDKTPFKSERAKLASYLNRLAFNGGRVGGTGEGGEATREGLQDEEERGDPQDAPVRFVSEGGRSTEGYQKWDGAKSRSEDGSEKGTGSVLDYFKGTGSWRERTARLPEGKRKPWFSPAA